MVPFVCHCHSSSFEVSPQIMGLTPMYAYFIVLNALHCKVGLEWRYTCWHFRISLLGIDLPVGRTINWLSTWCGRCLFHLFSTLDPRLYVIRRELAPGKRGWHDLYFWPMSVILHWRKFRACELNWDRDVVLSYIYRIIGFKGLALPSKFWKMITILMKSVPLFPPASLFQVCLDSHSLIPGLSWDCRYRIQIILWYSGAWMLWLESWTFWDWMHHRVLTKLGLHHRARNSWSCWRIPAWPP